MTIIIAIFMLFCYLLIATERITGANKAAVAMFAGTLGWVLYVSFGNDFVMAQHSNDYIAFLKGTTANSSAVKDYIAQNVFVRYVGKASEIVLFLLAVNTIVGILKLNGCFDFLSQWFRMRRGRTLIWLMSIFTLIVSANIDNLTTTVLMLTLMHKLLSNRRQRVLFGTAIVLSANIGGALTVIGDTNGLMLWNLGAVTPSHFSAWMMVPCLLAWGVPITWLSLKVPENIDIERVTMPYRGDDTRLKMWQRIMLFFLALGGIWFIPTFHNITHLSPFLGALCVLSVIWTIDEVFSRGFLNPSDRVSSREQIDIQNSTVQTLLFVMGIMLSVGVLIESGASLWFGDFCRSQLGDVFLIYVAPVVASVVSMFLDTFATASAFFSLYDVTQGTGYLAENGIYWILIAYGSAIGSNILCVGSLSGVALMATENITVGRYLRLVSLPVSIGGLVGLAVLIGEVMYFG